MLKVALVIEQLVRKHNLATENIKMYKKQRKDTNLIRWQFDIAYTIEEIAAAIFNEAELNEFQQQTTHPLDI